MDPNKFEKAMGALIGLPDVIHTAATTVRGSSPLVGSTQTFIVQTFRQRDEDKSGDTIFLEYVDCEGTVRIVIPPAVAKVIARQRDALTDRSRSRAAQAAAADRKARGIVPGFLKRRAAKAGGR
jgi:hypothetical protein